MLGRILEVAGDWFAGLLGRLEAKATGRKYEPKDYARPGGWGGEDDGVWDEPVEDDEAALVVTD